MTKESLYRGSHFAGKTASTN